MREERSQSDRRAQEGQALRCVLIALMDKEGRELEELEAVDSANLIRDFAVDAEVVSADRTDAHMIDMNMFLKNVENSVSKILTEKEMVYHQRLEEMESRLRGVMVGMGTSKTTASLATAGPVSSASDRFLSVRSRKSVASYRT